MEPWNDKIKQLTLSHAHDIFKMNIMEGGINIPQVLEDTYFNSIFEKMSNTFNDERSTMEIKKRQILTAAEHILQSKESHDMAYYGEILKDMSAKQKEGKKSDLFKRVIELRDDNLKTIYGNIIYPQYMGTTAKPRMFKTTLLLNLLSHLEEIGKRCAWFSFEDDKDLVALKILAIKTGIDKDVLVRQKLTNDKFDQAIQNATKNIMIFDKIRTSRELEVDINNLCRSVDIDFIGLDYCQITEYNGRQSEYEMLKEFTSTWLRLNKTHKIPMMALSQVDKDHMVGSGYLELGAEKGSGDIANNVRHNISLNEPLDGSTAAIEGYTRVVAYANKVTFGAEKKVYIDIEPKSGQIRYTGVMDENRGND
jgi:hypothetical protein